ncbi:MAG: iron-containing alcohol dehydrogenase [Deltaproteobacteria bacterium]|nr:iron-containing alcohol dehydrogenase [Deltaproteobacteria bacterium]
MSIGLPQGTSGRFDWQRQWQSVVYGRGSLAQLEAEIDALGARRVMIVTTGSLENQGTVLKTVEDALGSRLVGRFSGCRQYAPRSTVVACVARARELSPDLLVSLGGGSVVDTAKATALMSCENLREAADLDRYRGSGAAACRLTGRPIPLIALPTTLSAAEYSPMIAITNEASGEREPFQNSALCPRVVLLDPELTRATPDYLWLTTGIKILSDAFEQFSTGVAGPVMEPLTLRAFELLVRELPASRGVSSEARLACQLGSWLGLFGTFSAGTKVGIGAAIRHQLGMIHKLSHGEATCGILARVVGASAPTAPGPLGALCHAVDVPFDPADPTAASTALAERMDALLAELELPRTLAALRIRREDLPELARRAAGDFAARSRSARIWSQAEIEGLLEASL